MQSGLNTDMKDSPAVVSTVGMFGISKNQLIEKLNQALLKIHEQVKQMPEGDRDIFIRLQASSSFEDPYQFGLMRTYIEEQLTHLRIKRNQIGRPEDGGLLPACMGGLLAFLVSMTLFIETSHQRAREVSGLGAGIGGIVAIFSFLLFYAQWELLSLIKNQGSRL